MNGSRNYRPPRAGVAVTRRSEHDTQQVRRRTAQGPAADFSWLGQWFQDGATAFTAAERLAFEILRLAGGNEVRSEAEDFWAFVLFQQDELPPADFVQGFALGALDESATLVAAS